MSTHTKQKFSVGVRQYAYGMQMVNSPRNSAGAFSPSKDTDEPPAIPWQIQVVFNSGGAQAKICLPQNGCLGWNGTPLTVAPPEGSWSDENSYYDVPTGKTIWCAVRKEVSRDNDGNNSVLTARLYESTHVPNDALAKFPVAEIPSNLYNGTVRQFAYGYIELSSPVPVVPGPFAPVYAQDGVTVTAVTDCYYQAGGYTWLLDTYALPDSTTGVVALRYNASGSGNNAQVRIYDSIGALNTAQMNANYVIVPLFVLQNSQIRCDLRAIPHVQVAELVYEQGDDNDSED